MTARPMNLTTLAGELGDSPAYVMADTGQTLTYAELEAESNRVAHWFREAGLRPGDHIALLVVNDIAAFPLLWASQRSGLYCTPVNHHLSPAEAGFVVDDCEARLLVHSASLSDLAGECARSAPRLERVIALEELIGESADRPAEPLADECEGAVMFYSSGTTGRPKGIVPAAFGAPFGESPLHLDRVVSESFGFGRDTVYLSPGPLYHAAPLLWSMATVRNGGRAVIMSRFDAEACLRAIETYRITAGQFVPTMFVRMLKLPDAQRLAHDLSSLRLVVHAAAPCPPDVKRRMIDWLGPILLEYYAGSEANGMCAITSSEWLTHPRSVGRGVSGTPHVCDAAGQDLPAGEVGQIWFADGPDFSYHRDPEKTAAAHDERGWTTLGDLGHLDEDGYLYLDDRRTDLIITGGVNVYPREVEEVLTLHPAVADVAVVGRPDEEMGRRVHAVVLAADPTAAGPELADELIAYARERLAHFKAPRSLEFIAEFPRTASGKVLRRTLIEPRD